MKKSIKSIILMFKKKLTVFFKENKLLFPYMLFIIIIIIAAVLFDSEFITIVFGVIGYTVVNLYIRNTDSEEEQKKRDSNLNDIGLISLIGIYFIYSVLPLNPEPIYEKLIDAILIWLIATGFFLILTIIINKQNKKESGSD